MQLISSNIQYRHTRQDLSLLIINLMPGIHILLRLVEILLFTNKRNSIICEIALYLRPDLITDWQYLIVSGLSTNVYFKSKCSLIHYIFYCFLFL